MDKKLSKSLLVVSCLLAIAGCGSNSNSSINVSTSSSKVTSSTVDEVKGSLLILFKYDSCKIFNASFIVAVLIAFALIWF